MCFILHDMKNPMCTLGSDDSEDTKADGDKIDQVINSIAVHSNTVGETASMSQGMILYVVGR